MTLLLTFAVITLLFGLWLAVKQVSKLKLCAICLAVAVTWVGLLIAYRLGWFENQALVALLMGQSVVGAYYILERHSPTAWHFFRLPVLLSLTYIAFTAVTWRLDAPAILFVGLLWLIFGAVYAAKTAPPVKQLVRRVIDCCGGW